LFRFNLSRPRQLSTVIISLGKHQARSSRIKLSRNRTLGWREWVGRGGTTSGSKSTTSSCASGKCAYAPVKNVKFSSISAPHISKELSRIVKKKCEVSKSRFVHFRIFRHPTSVGSSPIAGYSAPFTRCVVALSFQSPNPIPSNPS